eukprot:TRINITY_DN34012_c0_g1_i1.p1 TRINITY_DN34012_c0_g1~~TRINITY_DN34012_c0_g1_i1.p1  ORF type:complete len:179 (-),score=39.49 TRINITY_DN34012_c0_g1_i1:72-608(-)
MLADVFEEGPDESDGSHTDGDHFNKGELRRQMVQVLQSYGLVPPILGGCADEICALAVSEVLAFTRVLQEESWKAARRKSVDAENVHRLRLQLGQAAEFADTQEALKSSAERESAQMAQALEGAQQTIQSLTAQITDLKGQISAHSHREEPEPAQTSTVSPVEQERTIKQPSRRQSWS